MRVNKLQGGGSPSSPSVQDTIPQYSSMEEMMAMSPYDRGGSGAVQNVFGPMDYIAGTFPLAKALGPAAQRVGRLLGLGADDGIRYVRPEIGANAVTGKVSRRSELGPELLPNRFDDALQYRAGRSLNQAATEDLAGQLNVQQQAKNALDEVVFEGGMDQIRYQKFLYDLEKMFNVTPGGRVSKEFGSAEQLTGPVTDLMKKYGLDVPPSVTQKLVDSMKPFQMNREGGKIPYKIVKK